MDTVPHTDPDQGVFETMLVVDGRPVELDAHLARLAASLAELYAAALPEEAEEAVRARAKSLGRGRMRLTVAPAPSAGNGLRVAIDATPVENAAGPPRTSGIALRSVRLPGGLGAHKWADRAPLQLAATGPGELPLLVDPDGTVFEAARANVFLAGDEWLATPPADGRILPGIARRRAIEIARAAGVETCERRITLGELRSGDVFLTGSVRGVEPVRALDGAALPPPGEISALVGDELRRRWLRAPRVELAAAGAGGRPAGRPAR